MQDLKDKGLVFSVLNSTSTTIINGTTITCGAFEQAIEQMKKQMKNKFEHLGDEIKDRININLLFPKSAAVTHYSTYHHPVSKVVRLKMMT